MITRTWRQWPIRWLARLRDGGPRVAVLVGVALIVVGIVGFAVVVDSVQEADDLASLDDPVLEGLREVRSSAVTAVLVAVTTVSGPVVLPIIVLVGALLWAFVGRQRWQAGLLAAAMLVSTGVSLVVKGIVARPRPPVDAQHVAGVEQTYSFPSGHTIGTATLLLVVGYLAWVRRPAWRSLLGWSAVVLVGTGLVALSRLYLGYHFVTDVVASFALALAVLGGVVTVDRRRAVRAAHRTAENLPTVQRTGVHRTGERRSADHGRDDDREPAELTSE